MRVPGKCQEVGLLAQVADDLLVVVGEQLHLQDGLGHLRRLLQVRGLQLDLQLGLVRPVPLERVEQDRGRLLEPVLLHEHLHNHVDVDQGPVSPMQDLRELGRASWVDGHHGRRIVE